MSDELLNGPFDPEDTKARMRERRAMRAMREIREICEQPLLCENCGEAIATVEELADVYPMTAHRVCMLRIVTGGIGHLIAHDWWCLVEHDPDAGLTPYQSAVLCDAFVRAVGVDEAVRRG